MKRKLRLILDYSGLLIAGITFIVSVNTSILPSGEIIPIITKKILIYIVFFLLCFTALLLVTSILLKYIGSPTPIKDSLEISRSFLILFIYPFTVFILYPLGVTTKIGILLNPKLILILTFSTYLYFLTMSIFQYKKTTQSWQRFDMFWSSRKLSWSLLFILLFLYGGVSLKENRIKFIVGDEPHYLLIMHSLEKYHTPELSKILKDQNCPQELLRIYPHKSSASVKNRIYSIHNIGLPLLLLFPHLLLGYQGIIFFINIITALLIKNIFLFSVEVSENKWTSFFTSLLLGTTGPIGFYFRFIYPDIVAALFVLYSYRIIRNCETGLIKILLASTCIAYLPWLHVKFTLLWITLLISFLVAERSKIRYVIVIILISTISWILLSFYFHNAYNNILPSAPYGRTNPPLSKFLFRGIPGLLFDINHGLFPLAPYFLLLIPGILPMFRKNKSELCRLILLILPSLLVFASHWMWWGGPCPPGRFLLPLVPLTTPILIYGFYSLSTTSIRSLTIALVSFSVYIGYLSFKFPQLLTIHKHIGSKAFIGIEAFPSFPVFTWLKSQNVPVEMWIEFLFWLIPCILLFRIPFSPKRSIPLNKLHLNLSGFILFLSLPGFYSAIFSSFFSHTHFSSTITLPQMNYYLHQFAKPIIRARVKPKLIHQKIYPPVVLTSLLEYNRHFTPFQKGKFLITGPYIYLYPVRYKVTYFLQAVAKHRKPVGEVNISFNKGREILANQTVISTTTPSSQVITLSVFPQKIKPEAEFRFRQIGKATGMIKYILIQTIIGTERKT